MANETSTQKGFTNCPGNFDRSCCHRNDSIQTCEQPALKVALN